MDLRHLLTFRAVVERGSFLRAADDLQYAQSTVTLHIQQLEADLGVKLFARQGKRAQLTEAGRVLREQAIHLLDHATLLQQTMSDLNGGESGYLRVGAVEPTASLRLPPLLVEFWQQRPRVRLTLEVAGTRTLSAHVAARELDVALCSPPPASLGLVFEPLFAEPMALLLPDDHALAASEVIHAADLSGQRLLLTEQTCAYRDVIERALAGQCACLDCGIEIGSLAALTRAVQCGLGMAIIPAVSVTPPPPGTVLRAVRQVDLTLPIGLVRPQETDVPSRALDALLEALRRHLAADSLMDSAVLAR